MFKMYIFQTADVCALKAEQFARFLDKEPIYTSTSRGPTLNDGPTVLRLFAQMLRQDFREHSLINESNEKRLDTNAQTIA